MNALSIQATTAFEALGYTNQRIIEKLMVDFGMDAHEASELFEDTKRFLYLCSKYPEGLRPTNRLDHGWHVMLLFTREYDDFCRTFFGRFIHHAPSVPSDGDKIASDSLRKLRKLARLEFGEVLSRNWGEKIAHVANCCTGGNCSNTGNCSHCTEG